MPQVFVYGSKTLSKPFPFKCQVKRGKNIICSSHQSLDDLRRNVDARRYASSNGTRGLGSEVVNQIPLSVKERDSYRPLKREELARVLGHPLEKP